MHADPELDAPLGRHAGVTFGESVLHLDRATHGVYNAAEFDEASVACALDHAPVMRGNSRVDQVAAQPSKPRQRAVFVRPGEQAVADHIRDEDRSDLPGLAHSKPPPLLRLARKTRPN